MGKIFAAASTPLAIAEGISVANQEHSRKLAREAAGKTPRQMVNIDSRTPTKTKITRGMEDGVNYYSNMAKGAAASVLGAAGDLAKWIDPTKELVILPTSKGIKRALDKAQKETGEAYVETVKKTIKSIKNITKKEIKDEPRPMSTCLLYTSPSPRDRG